MVERRGSGLVCGGKQVLCMCEVRGVVVVSVVLRSRLRRRGSIVEDQILRRSSTGRRGKRWKLVGWDILV